MEKMPVISIATFMHASEEFNQDFSRLVAVLRKRGFDVDAIVCGDQQLASGEYRFFSTPEWSKYRRIHLVFREALSDKVFFIDNDITLDMEAFIAFVTTSLGTHYGAAWGRIDSFPVRAFIPKLVAIDKRLSHDCIRPLLWKLGMGISIPGQIFMLDRREFAPFMSIEDTVFDDLSLGTICRSRNVPYYYSKQVLGFEMPKGTFIELCRQRMRWAKGFAETVWYSRRRDILPLVLLHGAMYHLLWLPFWGLIFCSLPILLPFVCLWLVRWQFLCFFEGLAYLFVFPFLHCIWLFSFVKNLFSLLRSG